MVDQDIISFLQTMDYWFLYGYYTAKITQIQYTISKSAMTLLLEIYGNISIQILVLYIRQIVSLNVFSSWRKEFQLKVWKSSRKAEINSIVRWYMSSFHSCILCCFKTCQNNPQQRSLKGMSALWLCKSNWVLYSRFKIFITQKLLTASWFVSVFYGYSCHMQPPQFLIIFYGMCFPPFESLSHSLLHMIFSSGREASIALGLHHWKYSYIITYH